MDYDLSGLLDTEQSNEQSVDTSLGEEFQPHFDAWNILVGMNQVEKFKARFCMNNDPDEWLKAWFNKPNVVFGCSPKKAIETRRFEEVEKFVTMAAS
jgi:hypothetical protein